MQKQYSESHSSHDKHSISSRSARKLYHRIHNNNIRLINKSKISNHSNRSIGSVALRRTQLSNDKIYSREQEMGQVNSSQAGVSFESGFDLQSDHQSIPMTPVMSNHNSRPRGIDSPSQRSLRSDSQKSSKCRPNHRKYNKNEIQKLLMLEANENFNNGTQNKGRQNKRQSRSNSRRQKQSIPSPRIDEKQLYSQNESKLRSIRTIKSSEKSKIKLNPSRNIKQQPKYALSPQQSNEIQKLARKYKQIVNGQSIKSSRDIMGAYNERIEQMYIGQPKLKNVKNDWYEEERGNSRNLQKYRSQKYLPSSNQSELYSLQSRKKRTYAEERLPIEQKPSYISREGKPKVKNDKYHYDAENYKNQKKNENSLEKYQKDTWARTFNRKYVQASTDYRKFNAYDHQMKRYTENPDHQIDKFPKKHYENQRTSKNHDKRRKNYYETKQDSEIGTKNERSQLNNIRIKQDKYGNLYGKQQNQRTPNKSNPRSPNYKSPSYNSPHHKQKPQPDHEYYHHIHGSHKKHGPHVNTPQTQISSTFDSLMLSINSHITSGIGQSTNVKSIVDKINLHLGTLELISDYALEFKKMYEQIDDWEELIFLAYKKFWVERSKVLEYLKKFRKSKRHQSERMMPNGSRKMLENKLSSIKNILSDIPQLSRADDPFADQKLITNPFIIPFCKVNQQEAKKVAQSQEGGLLILKLQKQLVQIYQKLQQMYNLVISKSGSRINMLYCDNFSDEIFVMMLDEIEQLIPNLEEFKLFEATKVRLGKIVKSGILILYMNGKVIRNIAEIITFDDCEKIGSKRKIKTFTTYDLYYEVFEKMVAE